MEDTSCAYAAAACQEQAEQADKETAESSQTSEDAVCAICFEQRPFVVLPCACTSSYCGPCWDRALAASVTVRGRAQCPSCRMALRVDYNTDVESLEFSKETERATLTQWRQRLYKKVKPVQIRLLQDYGAHCQAKATFNESSSPHCSDPICVCGGVMEKIDGFSRVVRMLEDTEPGWRSRVTHDDRLVQKLAMSSLITCDLCDEVAMPTGFVWTCKNGPHTVLHPAAYDVCERCFNHYAAFQEHPSEEDHGDGCSAPPPSPARQESPQACPHSCSGSGGCSGSGCSLCRGSLFRSIRWPRSPSNGASPNDSPSNRASSRSRVRSAMSNVVRGLRSTLPRSTSAPQS